MQGSGFVLDHGGESFLVTNGHIVTGLNRKTGKPLHSAALPQNLRIVIPVVGRGLDAAQGSGGEELNILGTRTTTVDLYDDRGQAIWYCHPQFGRRVDIVALPLGEPAELFPDLRGVYLPYRLAESVPKLEPPDELCVIGFPYGLRGGSSTAIWVRGTVASEPDFTYEGESCFLIDARTRDGQSGSPVIKYPSDSESGWDLIGVYASRIEDSTKPLQSTDLGRVWTAAALSQVVEGESREGLTFE